MAVEFSGMCLVARDIVRCLRDSGNLKFPIPVKDGILPVIEKIVSAETSENFRIRLHAKNRTPTDVHSFVVRYRDRADIFYSMKENVCWRRFAVCKELFHIAFDQPGSFTQDYMTLAQEIVTETSFEDSSSESMDSERLATLGALETLIPWSLRKEVESMRTTQKLNDREIAEICRVPERYVNLMLHSSYRVLSNRVNRQLDNSRLDDWSS